MENEQIRTIVELQTDVEVALADFGYVDHKGRKIGAKISTYERTMVAAGAEYDGCFFTLAPGHYYVLRSQATRNGVEYGATQRSHHFKTPEERERALGKYLRSAELLAKRKGAGR